MSVPGGRGRGGSVRVLGASGGSGGDSDGSLTKPFSLHCLLRTQMLASLRHVGISVPAPFHIALILLNAVFQLNYY